MVRSLPSDGLSDGRQIPRGEARSSSATLRPNVGVVQVYLSIHQEQHMVLIRARLACGRVAIETAPKQGCCFSSPHLCPRCDSTNLSNFGLGITACINDKEYGL